MNEMYSIPFFDVFHSYRSIYFSSINSKSIYQLQLYINDSIKRDHNHNHTTNKRYKQKRYVAKCNGQSHTDQRSCCAGSSKIFYEFYLVFRLKYNLVLTNKNNFIFLILSKDDFTNIFFEN